jgi:hypothetical protein
MAKIGYPSLCQVNPTVMRKVIRQENHLTS